MSRWQKNGGLSRSKSNALKAKWKRSRLTKIQNETLPKIPTRQRLSARLKKIGAGRELCAGCRVVCPNGDCPQPLTLKVAVQKLCVRPRSFFFCGDRRRSYSLGTRRGGSRRILLSCRTYRQPQSCPPRNVPSQHNNQRPTIPDRLRGWAGRIFDEPRPRDS